MGKKLLQIAIDGPIGSGKSTVARLLAKKLNLFLVDAGALYRAAAYLSIRDGLTPEEHIIRSLKERDELDMRRPYAPLIKADGAVLIDTTEITAEQAVEEIIKLVPEEYLE